MLRYVILLFMESTPGLIPWGPPPPPAITPSPQRPTSPPASLHTTPYKTDDALSASRFEYVNTECIVWVEFGGYVLSLCFTPCCFSGFSSRNKQECITYRWLKWHQAHHCYKSLVTRSVQTRQAPFRLPTGSETGGHGTLSRKTGLENAGVSMSVRSPLYR